MEKNDKIYIAGHTGLVGSTLLKKLENEGYTNLVYKKRYELNLTNQQDVINFFEAENPKYVFLCAALVGGIKDNDTRRGDFIYKNLMIQNNIIDASMKYGTKKLLFLGSSCIYPRDCPQPIKEEYLLTGPLEQTNEPYAIAKIAGVKLIESYRRQFYCDFISVMPTNLYGSECFSEDTDLLTVDGIKNIKDINIGDRVYTLNKDTLEVEIESIIDTQKVYTDEFYNFKTTNCDFRVTPNHKILYKTRSEYPLLKKEAFHFKDKIGKNGSFVLAKHRPMIDGKIIDFDLIKYKDKYNIIRECDNFIKDGKHSNWKFHPTKFDLMDLCNFIGWYVSEGSIVDNMKTKYSGLDCGQIRISQNKSINPDNYNNIDELLSRMKLNYGKDNFAFYFTSRTMKKFIRDEMGVGSKNKKLPKFVFELPVNYRKIIFESLMKGDGDKSGRRFTTNSEQLKNDFIHLCFTLGINVGKIYNDGCWRISILKSKNLSVKYKNISIDKVENSVAYCVTTEKNHIVYAGRNNQFNWIGQCDNYDLETSHVFAAMIRKIHEAKVNGTDVTLWGDGSPYREFLFVEDLADALIFLMDNYSHDDPINVGTGKDISIKELSEKIAEVIGFKGDIIWDTTKPNGTPRKRLDVSRLENMGWKYKTELDDGIKIAYQYFLDSLKS